MIIFHKNFAFVLSLLFSLSAQAGTWGDVVCHNPAVALPNSSKSSVFIRGIFQTESLSLETLHRTGITFKSAPHMNVYESSLNRDRQYEPTHPIYDHHHRFTFANRECRLQLLLPWVIPIRYDKEGAHSFRGFLQIICPSFVKAVSLGCSAI